MVIRSIVTGKNQLTIPAALARELNIEPGTEMIWRINEDRDLVISPVLSREERVRRLEGLLQPYLKPGDDPIANLIRERELMDEEID